MKKASGLLILVIMIFLLAALPSLLSYGRKSNVQYYSNSDDPDFLGSKLYKLHFNPENLWRKPLQYFRQLKAGNLFDYLEGKTKRSWLVQAPRYFSVSILYITATGIISLIVALSASLYMSDKKRNPAFYEFLSFMTVFPDFILIFFIQFLFFFINKAAGGQIIRLYTASSSARAIFLPILVMCIYPVLYILRTTGNSMKYVNKEQFILFARSKGLHARRIRIHHIGPAAVVSIKKDLHKIVTILFSNLFITELMFNNKGITFFLFNNISQYACTVNTLFVFILMYLILYLILNFVLEAAGLIIRRELP